MGSVATAGRAYQGHTFHRTSLPKSGPIAPVWGKVSGAGFGVGIFRSPGAAAAAWVKAGRVTKPDRRLSKYYGRRYRRYVSLLNRTNEWSGE